MKRRLLVLTIVLALIVACVSVPSIFAENDDITTSLSIVEVVTPTKVVDFSQNTGVKSIDMFVGESITFKTNILIKKPIVIEDDSTIMASYRYDSDIFDIDVKRGDMLPNKGEYDSGNAYLRREEVTVTARSASKKSQIIAQYIIGGKPYFDSIDINVVGNGTASVADNIESMELKPNVTTLKSHQKVDFDLIINGSDTLSASGDISYNINGVDVSSLNDYEVAGDIDKLDIKVTFTDSTGKTREYVSTLSVASANELTTLEVEKESFGYMLKNKTGKIAIYCTKGSFPNINVVANSATLTNAELVESDREGMDKYLLTINLNNATQNEEILISADKKLVTASINIIDTINSVTIVPENTKFESGKVSVFHIAVNGVKDVDTDVTWTVNGTEQSTKNNVLEYKTISSNEVIVTAVIDDFSSEYKYTIDTSKDSILLTVISSVLVIAIFLPVLLALKKKKKPDLMALILKDNDTISAKLTKLKDDINNDETKDIVKHLIKISSLLTRSEKRAQQESFECENKAFSAALTSITEAKDLVSELVTRKDLPKQVMLNIVDNAVLALDNANSTIKKVQSNM